MGRPKRISNARFFCWSVETLQVITGSRQSPHPKYYVGEGKAQEIAQAVKLAEADIVIFNHSLSPAQERNLEQLCECRVLRPNGT